MKATEFMATFSSNSATRAAAGGASVLVDNYNAVLRQAEKVAKLQQRFAALSIELAREQSELARMQLVAAKAGR